MWDWLFQFIDPLQRAGIPYAIVGSVASSVYGEPRATNDVDVVIQLGVTGAAKLVNAFPADRFYVPPIEVIEVELARGVGAHLNIIALESMAKADIYPLSTTERIWFERRRSFEVDGRPIWFAPPESVILHKLRFFREGGADKHLRDIRGMLEVAGDAIDRAAIETAVREYGLLREWNRALDQSSGDAGRTAD
jgi:hypothetical protein